MEQQQKYKVVRVYRNSARREVLYKNMSRDEAGRCAMRFPTTAKSMVVFFKQ